VTRGGNYGWRVFEGTLCTRLDPTLCQNPNNYIFPVAGIRSHQQPLLDHGRLRLSRWSGNVCARHLRLWRLLQQAKFFC
jgi:hypothetical protein